MLNQYVGAAVAATEHAAESAANQALLVGGSIFAVFLVLLLITVSFTNVGRRHEAHAEVADTHRQHTNKHGHH
ncbi:hypothetical protein ACQ3I4_14035 [Zafaria sp. Z1313]|uniref:hypothetical protein n=1 Tax=unclassified Zafaria TaxID=2828765 RepID=UPI002E7830DC|nr:hypothetical protein [Zafaria sp. J156]MEE1622484.1 hypothetical protein [Zafaria sp. J156]